MNKNRKPLFYWALGGIVGALYVALCLLFAPVSYGAIQFRVADSLTIAGVIDWRVALGFMIGWSLANLVGGMGLIDTLFPFVLVLVVYGIPLLFAHRTKINPWIIFILVMIGKATALAIIGWYLSNILQIPYWAMTTSLWTGSVSVAIVFGVPIFVWLRKQKMLSWL